MITFKSFIAEGGNIKVKDSEGNEVSAAPFKVTNRSQQSKDISDALHAVHKSFHDETGKHLFGKDAKALNTGSAYSGSTKQFMNKDSSAGKISDAEFTKHKPEVGDIDVQTPSEHKDELHNHLTNNINKKFGKYTLVGVKKAGSETHAVMRHDDGGHHQFDFEHVEYHNHEPAEHEQFGHSSSWEDTKNGIKGAHHKILLSSAATAKGQKYSAGYGLRSRTDENDPGIKEPENISKSLFGNKANHKDIHSFTGIAKSIKAHMPAEQHQEIYDKFKDSMSKHKKIDSAKAIEHLGKTLGVK